MVALHVVFSKHLLVLLAFYGFVKWIREQRTGRLLLMCTVIPFVFLTKPDAGLICTVALLLCMAVESVRVPECCGRIILGAVCLLMVVVATLLATRAANMHFHGSESAFCSNDNYWPRLFGLNYKTSGRCNNEDIRVRYKELTGKSIVLRSQRCPVELIPLIKAEMSSRIRKMSMLKFAKLIFRKQQYAWTKTLSGSRRNSLKSKSLRNVIDFSKCVIFLLGIFSLLRLMFTGHGGYLRMLIILYIVGIVMMLSIAESNSRYCAIIGVFVPLLFGLAMDCSTVRTATRKALVRRGSSDNQIAERLTRGAADLACLVSRPSFLV